MEKYLRFYLGALILISILIFGYLGLIKPLWLDELFSLQIIANDSIAEIVRKLYIGSDTNAPLYFILLKSYTYVFNTSEFALKLLSLCLTLASLIVIYKIIKLFISDTISQLIVLTFVIVSQAFSTYLLVEVRMYSFYFLLSNLLIYYYLTIDTVSIRHVPLFSLLITALLYTHYFAFYLIISIFLLEILNKRRIIIFLSILLGIVFFSPWFAAIYNQLQIGQGFIYHGNPNFESLSYQYFFLVGKGGIVILTFVVSLNFLMHKKIDFTNQISLAIILTFIPLLNILLSAINLSVQVPRYFIFSFIGLVMILSITLNNLNDNKFVKLVLVLLLTVFSINRIIFYKNLIEIDRKEIDRVIKYCSEKIPIVCESPHKQYPLNYYSAASNVFFILDSLSAFSEGNIKNAPFDYHLLSNYKKYYNLKNVVYYDDFKSMHKKFILIDEKDRMLFEVRFYKNARYNIKLISKDIYLIERYEV